MSTDTALYDYDNEGQLASKQEGGTTNYSFDKAYRLTGIGNDTFSYDGAGNRLRAVRSSVETRYIYDANGNLLAEADGSNTITRYYVHGAGLLAAITPANDLYCYHYDATGNTVAITDSSETVVNSYDYSPFGMIISESEGFAQPFKYVGRLGVMAEANGFYYMRARYYDPLNGRFISEDPLGFDGGDVNLYVYGSNNPLLVVDPWGLATWGPYDDSSNTPYPYIPIVVPQPILDKFRGISSLEDRSKREANFIDDNIDFATNIDRRQRYYEPQIRQKAENLGRSFDSIRTIPTTGEIIFWGIGPMPGIYDFLPNEQKIVHKP